MRPDRVLLRFLSWPEIRRAFGTRTVRVTAQSRRRQVARVIAREKAAGRRP